MGFVPTLRLGGAFTAGKHTGTDVRWSETSQQSQTGGAGGGASLIGLLRARLYHVSLRLQVFVWDVKSPGLECQTVFFTVSYLSLSSLA